MNVIKYSQTCREKRRQVKFCVSSVTVRKLFRNS